MNWIDTGNRTPNSNVNGSGANHYPGAPALYPGRLWDLQAQIYPGEDARLYPRVHSKQYRFFRRNPSVQLPCNPRRTLGLHGNCPEGFFLKNLYRLESRYWRGCQNPYPSVSVCIPPFFVIMLCVLESHNPPLSSRIHTPFKHLYATIPKSNLPPKIYPFLNTYMRPA